MTNSRQKGKRGERLAVKLFRSYGFTARRGQQHRGGPDSPDIIVDELPDWHFEIKQGYRSPTPELWMRQAKAESAGRIPCVLWKPGYRSWRAIVCCSSLEPQNDGFLACFEQPLASQYCDRPTGIRPWGARVGEAVHQSPYVVFWGGYGGFVEFDAANLLTELSVPPDGV